MELSQIGFFSKTHGVKGQLVLKITSDFFAGEAKVLFVESATGKAPFFIRELRESNNGLIAELEEIDAVEKARALIGKKVFVNSDLLDKEDKDQAAYVGFELHDKHFGYLGNIVSVSDNGQQLLLSIDHKGREVILPLVDQFVERVDESQKKIYFNAPDGLIDVYLGPDEEI